MPIPAYSLETIGVMEIFLPEISATAVAEPTTLFFTYYGRLISYVPLREFTLREELLTVLTTESP